MRFTGDKFITYDFLESFLNIYRSLTGYNAGELMGRISYLSRTFFSYYLLFSLFITILIIILIFIVYRKLSALQLEIREKQNVLYESEAVTAEQTNKRWDHVLELLSSDNPSDWRLSILEADILLDEMVTELGYEGEGLGDKLKNVDKSDFRTLDDAWEAHKIRNILAHRGSDYILTKREARRVIDLFARVFEEFSYI